MTPIERAARALCELNGNPSGATMDGKPLWMDYLPEVHAVIDALHEPTRGMRESGAEIMRATNPDQPSIAAEDDAANVWRLMVDAMRRDI